MKLADENKFNSLERPKQMTLLATPWSVEEGTLTPTFKLKRNVMKEKYAKDIERMYKSPIMKVIKGQAPGGGSKVDADKKT